MSASSARSLVVAAIAALSLPAVAAPAAAQACPMVTVADTIAQEADTGTTTSATFTIVREGTSGPSEVDWFTQDLSARSPADYKGGSGTVEFAEGTTITSVTIPVVGDPVVEGDEAFLFNIEWDGCGSDEAEGIIDDDDRVAAGYRLVAMDGGVFSYGEGRYLGSPNTIPAAAPLTDIAETPDRDGYWVVGMDGGVFAYGNAPFFGSAGGLPLNEPVFGMAARPEADGYWLVALDGGVFAFGNAPFLGSAVEETAAPVVAIVATSTGRGYWLVATDGTVFAYGDAEPLGDHEARDVEVVGMDRTADNGGYWLTNVPGNVIPFGNAEHEGQIADPERLNGSIVSLEATDDGEGYWLLGFDGGVFAFGSAAFRGSAASLALNAPVLGMAGSS